MSTPSNSEVAEALSATPENPVSDTQNSSTGVSEPDQQVESQREGEIDILPEINVDDEAVPEASLTARNTSARKDKTTGNTADEEAAEGDSVPETELTLAEVRRNDGATIALVAGQAVTELPKDLYIPPEALEVFLETFEGPLDLLLYLIRRQNLDILEVSVSEITTQYMGYIDLMSELQLELVGEYLVMAAMLAEIKSRMLLPRPESIVDDEADPRAELIRRLQQYERFKSAAENIDTMPRLDRDITIARAERPELVRLKADPDVDLRELLVALGQIMRKADMFQKHAIHLEPLTVRERMSNVLLKIRDTTEFVSFVDLFDHTEGRAGVVVTFLAVLELVRESLLDIVQNEPFAPIYVRPAAGGVEGAAADSEFEADNESAFEDDDSDHESADSSPGKSDINDMSDHQDTFE